jgi:hypothetical protein
MLSLILATIGTHRRSATPAFCTLEVVFGKRGANRELEQRRRRATRSRSAPSPDFNRSRTGPSVVSHCDERLSGSSVRSNPDRRRTSCRVART